jgi:hypothetical protein
MELSVLLNYLRFFGVIGAVSFYQYPLLLFIFFFCSTCIYGIVIPFAYPKHWGVIIHKSISHIPSTILLVLASYHNEELRFIFLLAGGIQYLNIWLQMYSEVFTKELRNQIREKRSPMFVEEICWVFSDVIDI